MTTLIRILLAVGVAAAPGVAEKKIKESEMTPLDRYVQEALERSGGAGPAQASPGSIWSPNSGLTELARDVRASQVDDIVTILVVEKASAISRGTTKTSRQSSVRASIGPLAGKTRPALTSLAKANSETALDGEGATSRETVLTTTLAARVTHVLPNGNLVVEAAKDVQVNSERQTVTVRGVVRPADLTPGNVVRSDDLAQLELKINGKGVVGDAIRRPFFLYRLLLGLLPL